MNNKKISIIWHSIIFLLNLASLLAFVPLDKSIRILSFYTNYNHLLYLIYIAWSLFKEISSNSPKSQRLQQFALFVLYSSLIVTISFWIMYSYDPQLILTKKQISFALLVLLHGGNLLFMIFEFIYVIDITQTTTTIYEAIYSIVGYVFIIIANFFMSQLLRGKGMFPYPVQKHFSLEINILLVLLFVCIILSLYYFVKGLFANKYSDQLMIEKVAQIYNISQLALWGWILIKIVKQTIEEDNDSTSIDCWVKLAQTTQVMDLVFNFIGHTKGSLMNNILQLGGRLLVAWVFIYPGVCFCSLRNAVLAWSLAELIRFSYYLFKDAPIIKTLRYNGFLVLYPFGITGEVRLVERYLEKNPDQLFLLRGIQAILLVGCAFLYLQMLRSRGKPAKIVETKGRASSPTSRHKRE